MTEKIYFLFLTLEERSASNFPKKRFAGIRDVCVRLLAKQKIVLGLVCEQTCYFSVGSLVSPFAVGDRVVSCRVASRLISSYRIALFPSRAQIASLALDCRARLVGHARFRRVITETANLVFIYVYFFSPNHRQPCGS